jgi:hypothetical protein
MSMVTKNTPDAYLVEKKRFLTFCNNDLLLEHMITINPTVIAQIKKEKNCGEKYLW